MSQCVLDRERYDVAIGWDAPMTTFFAQVLDNEVEGEEDERTIFCAAGADGRYCADPDGLIRAIEPYACMHQFRVLQHELLKDKRTGVERIYSLDEDDLAPL
jgi:hypothetical protein